MDLGHEVGVGVNLHFIANQLCDLGQVITSSGLLKQGQQYLPSTAWCGVYM